MADSYIGEVRIFPYQFVPEGWLECNGQVVPVQPYQALYAVIGNLYGGSAPSTFGLPNLTGRVPVGVGQGPGTSLYNLGAKYGAASVQIPAVGLPAHTHTATLRMGKDDPAQQGNAVFLSDPTGADWQIPMSRSSSSVSYAMFASFAAPSSSYLAPQTLGASGGVSGTTAVHANEQPFLAFRFCICTLGIFPIRS